MRSLGPGPASLAAIVFITVASFAAALACTAHRGQQITLASQSLDPDVFVWDSVQRLVDYSNGRYDVETVLRHTILVKPGTTAKVLSCRTSSAKDKATYTKVDADFLSVVVTGGPYRGRAGWVGGADARRPDGMPLSPAHH